MTTLYAQPYDIFIDGETIDAQLFKALSVHQGNFAAFLEAGDTWEEEEKVKVIIAVGENGYIFDFDKDSPNQFDVDLYEMDNLRELAIYFVEEDMFGEIAPSIQNYLDYDAISRGLGIDYSEIEINGKYYVYR